MWSTRGWRVHGGGQHRFRIVIAPADGASLLRMQRLFEANDRFEVVDFPVAADEVVDSVRRYRPDVLILDLDLPGSDGLAVLRRVRAELPSSAVVLIARAIDTGLVLEALRLGLRGLVLKSMGASLLLRCVESVLRGEPWYERSILARTVQSLMRSQPGTARSDELTPREVEIARMVVRGLANKEIAQDLGIGVGTVRAHLSNIYRKLNLSSRLELALRAREPRWE